MGAGLTAGDEYYIARICRSYRAGRVDGTGQRSSVQ